MTPEDKKRTTDTLKELRHAFKCDTLAGLGKILGVSEPSIRHWACYGVPQDKSRLLEIILEMKQRIEKFEEEW